MAVTVQMIENKEFRTKPNGFDPEEVDAFLDEIIEEFEDMQHEIQALRQASLRPQASVASTSSLTDSTESVVRILDTAQRVHDETIADAKRQAGVILNDAKERATQMIEEAENEEKRLKKGLDTVRNAIRDYQARFQRLVDDQMRVINAEAELFR